MIFHFEIKAISDNQLYCNNSKGGKGRFVSAAGRSFKKGIYEATIDQIKQQDRCQHKYTELIKSLTNKELIVAVIHCSSWYLKDGSSIRKKDIQNFNKALLDSCFEALQTINDKLDDSQIWSYCANKIEMTENGDKEYIEIIITPVEDALLEDDDNDTNDEDE